SIIFHYKYFLHKNYMKFTYNLKDDLIKLLNVLQYSTGYIAIKLKQDSCKRIVQHVLSKSIRYYFGLSIQKWHTMKFNFVTWDRASHYLFLLASNLFFSTSADMAGDQSVPKLALMIVDLTPNAISENDLKENMDLFGEPCYEWLDAIEDKGEEETNFGDDEVVELPIL
ncbi:hypothetical protein ACJX0J_028811, partial [Zea mays]